MFTSLYKEKKKWDLLNVRVSKRGSKGRIKKLLAQKSTDLYLTS